MKSLRSSRRHRLKSKMTEPKEQNAFVQNGCASIPGMKRFSHEAMATTYEVIVVHEDEQYAKQAAAAAFEEVDRLEGELSRFIENSDISGINSLPANKSMQLGLDSFACLQISATIHTETGGAFDITIGSLFKCWRNKDGTLREPLAEELDFARKHTGTNLLQLDEASHTVELLTAPVLVDLGGVGKGYAVDRMAELLREWSIDIALISGGYSSVLALDAPPGTQGWPLTLSNPDDHQQILARPRLRNRALSGSGVQKGQHIIDPRTGRPVKGKRAAWSSAPDAATADALSTAFMIMSHDEIERYCSEHPEVLAMIIIENGHKEGRKENIRRIGAWVKDWLAAT